MEFLGIGPLELVFILLIILLVVGPKDIQSVARSLGRFLNQLYKSENYRVIQQASQGLRDLPQRLAHEAEQEMGEELRSIGAVRDELKRTAEATTTTAPPNQAFEAWRPPDSSAPPPPPTEPPTPPPAP